MLQTLTLLFPNVKQFNIKKTTKQKQIKGRLTLQNIDQGTGKAQRLCMFTVLLYHKIPKLLFVLGKVYNIPIHPTTIPQTHTVQEIKKI